MPGNMSPMVRVAAARMLLRPIAYAPHAGASAKRAQQIIELIDAGKIKEVEGLFRTAEQSGAGAGG